ncbi:pre-mRNA-processing ATP-dependent RNA helicase PRP5-like [Salvia splendens]|uniref:pre-mRNA-processing ATP-dependent RNA helicase PRP5-like n=1 Tax=Salvia splendens TaxID=180675 RepID=UPI001C2741BE|nr:pre-mRNA-processing ATP-dependent RNA helicase PRP5-like [Salvia splendens]
MGSRSRKSRHRNSSPELSTSTADTSSSSAASSSAEELDSSSKSRKRRRDKDRHREEKRKSKKSRRDEERSKKKTKQSRRDRERHKRRDRRKRRYDSEDESGSESDSEVESAESVVRFILKEFPGVAGDLEQLLRMIDEGQAVDIRGLSEKSLVKHLRRLFISLNLKENGDKVFLLPDKASPTLDIVGPFILSYNQPRKVDEHLESHKEAKSVPPVPEMEPVTNNVDDKKEDHVGPRRRVIGPEMPSADLLAAAAKLTEAEAELREAELDGGDDLFIGPPPPAVVKEAESANEAERFEEITRIIAADADSPYDIVGVNKDMAAENIKKRYWKLSLMVHPDKSSHPQAHQAFVKLNKAFKDLQDPAKRKVLDDKLKEKEEREAFQIELKAMREAAQWRRLQGIAMEGDDLLLAEMDAKAPPKRDEWMTTLPPERKPATGASMHSTRFSKTGKEGRGDTSVWTDTPSERAQKAKMNYLEAYNEAAALASNEQENARNSADAELVDQYNKAKRSKSLVEKHMESAKSRSKKKTKQGKQEPRNEEWEGNHPWKPWDREKDLTAGRQSVNLDADNMAKGLTSRFSSGSFQRNFL